MPKKLLADTESESEYDNEYASDSVAQTLSKLDIQPITTEKQKRTLTAEHKAKMAAGKKLAAERRNLEKSFGKSAMDLKLGVLESNGLLTNEKLQEFQKIYEDLEVQFGLHYLLNGDKNTPKEEKFKNITKNHILIFLK